FPEPNNRGNRLAEDRRRSGRNGPVQLGVYHLHADLQRHRHSGRQTVGHLWPQTFHHHRAPPFHHRFLFVRNRRNHYPADPVPRTPGLRRRDDHVHGLHLRRGSVPPTGEGPLAGTDERLLRAGQRIRPVPGRLYRRPLGLALGILGFFALWPGRPGSDLPPVPFHLRTEAGEGGLPRLPVLNLDYRSHAVGFLLGRRPL